MTPDDTITQEALARLRAGNPAGAAQMLRNALAQNPRWAVGWFNLAHVLRTQGQSDGALKALATALECGLQQPEDAHLNRALIYSDQLHDDVAAEAELRRALHFRPGWLLALLNLGNLHEERGQRDAAAACYDQVLATEPPVVPEELARHRDLQVEALARRVHLSPTDAAGSAPAMALRTALHDAERGRAARINAGHSLGQWLDAQGRFDEAFDVLVQANRLASEHTRPYDPAGTERAVASLMRAYDGDERQAQQLAADDEFEPLFICGAFRSGSTLIEQVLGAHPDVIAGGELDWLMRRIMLPPLAPYPESVAALDAPRLDEVAQAYRAHLTRLFPLARFARYVTDKRPDNLLLVGLIKSLFPKARIVLTVRDPMDIGLSMYSQHLNPARVPYATDLGAIGHHLAQMQRLAAYWRSRWPGDVVEVDYDQLVREPRAAIERLLAFLGLPWDERCVDFHRHVGVVRTASFRQVRQPFHGRSSGRWRQYATHLEPLAQALRQNGLETG
jgi:tetratricopeptide (TPR) repeat protein